MPSKIHLRSVGRHCKYLPTAYQASFFFLHLFLISQSTLRSLGSAPCLGTVHRDDEPETSSCPASKQECLETLPQELTHTSKNLCQQNRYQGWGAALAQDLRADTVPRIFLPSRPTLPPSLQLLTGHSVSFPAVSDWEQRRVGEGRPRVSTQEILRRKEHQMARDPHAAMPRGRGTAVLWLTRGQPRGEGG